MLQHQTGGARLGRGQGPCFLQWGDQTGEQPPAGCSLLPAAGAAAPQMQRPELEQGVQLLLGQCHPPVIDLKVKRARPGGFVVDSGFG